MRKIYPVILFLALMTSVPVFPANSGVPAASATAVSNSGAEGSNFLQQYYDQDDNKERQSKYKPPNPIWSAIKVILYTGLFGVAAYFLIRYVISKGSLPASEDSKIVETLMNKSLGMGSYLQIVKVGSSYYLLGLSGEGVHLIDKITDQETIDFVELNKENLKPKETKFMDILSYLPNTKALDKFEFIRKTKDRLKKL